MSVHNLGHDPGHEPEEETREAPDASKGFEASDVRVPGVMVFLVALSIFVAVAGFLAYGLGKVINAHMAAEDGPANRWARPVDIRALGNMPNSPDMENKLGELTERFPAPRLQNDDGNQDLAELHAREDLLLTHYTWVDEAHSKARIPIERAMELIVQRGLPVAPPVNEAPLMTGDKRPVIALPLTDGFARTGFEQEQAAAVAGGRKESNK